ncbi:hypothetical protein V8F20_012100 [Naviculisporaceae sp. PSN 640]
MKPAQTASSLFLFLGSVLGAPSLALDASQELTSRAARQTQTYSWVSSRCPTSQTVYTNYYTENRCGGVPGASTQLNTIPCGSVRLYRSADCTGSYSTFGTSWIGRCLDTAAVNSLKLVC